MSFLVFVSLLFSFFPTENLRLYYELDNDNEPPTNLVKYHFAVQTDLGRGCYNKTTNDIAQHVGSDSV